MVDPIPEHEGYRLEFRYSEGMGANAVALPSGLIIVTDQLVTASHQDDEIIAIMAHEIGHHIQSVTGISESVRRIQAQNPGAKNELSVRQELQSDCLAGVWDKDASQRRNSDGTSIIETGDIEEGLVAAAAVGGDDQWPACVTQRDALHRSHGGLLFLIQCQALHG